MTRFGLRLPSLGDFADDPEDDEDTDPAESEGAPDEDETPTREPRLPAFSRSEKERRRYDRCYRRLAEIAPELRTLGRNIALRLILRAAVARLW
jgi:hypothetical protein